MATVRIFGHYVPGSVLLLALFEALILIASVYAGAYIRFAGEAHEIALSIGPLFPRALATAIFLLLSMSALGLYQTRYRSGPVGLILRISMSFIFGLIGLVVLFYIAPYFYLGRGALAISLLLSLVGISALHLIFFHYMDADLFKRRVLILGAGEKASAMMLWMRRKSDQRNFRIVGFVPVDGDKSTQTFLNPILPIVSSLNELVRRHDIDEVVVAMDERRNNLPIPDLLSCRLQGISIIDAITFMERETGKVKLDLLYPSWLIFSDGYRHGTIHDYGKRLLDITASLAISIIALPVMLITAIAILIESRGQGPIFYRQIRVGQDGRPFHILKFRSMVVDAEKQGAQWATKADPRITSVGAVIRKYRIDELPQLINVIRGDMSLVGPRPERPEFVAELNANVPFYGERHRVKPGITGWAQLNYPYGACAKDALEKLQYELYYVKNQSLFLDFMILVQTVEVVLFGKGAR
jgi:sugar transferase (PEP-CTERM system associated)